MPHLKKYAATRRKLGATQGFTLLELLVGVIVLSLGILSVASLQITTTQGNHVATQRLEAAMLVESAVNRMRGNPERLDDYSGHTFSGSSAPAGTRPTGCTSSMDEAVCLTAVANLDLWELGWEIYTSDSLVNPTLCITDDDTNPGLMTVVIAWHGMTNRAAGNSVTLNACGQIDDDADTNNLLQQVVFDTYITNRNPY